MATGGERVVVAMSGGVDSSVAACLLKERGYDVVGLFMRTGVHAGEPSRAPDDTPRESESPAGNDRSSCGVTAGSRGEGRVVRACGAGQAGGDASGSAASRHQGCCSASDAADARYVAGMLDAPFYALNFEKDFGRLIDFFADEYARGRTPNPCVVCNDRFKFGRIVEYADAVGAKYIATGHYARIAQVDGHHRLVRGRDGAKDQSYVLFGLPRKLLPRVMFPVGDLFKDQVRTAAGRWKLPNRSKPDSVEICFAADRDYAGVVRSRRPDAFVAGDVLDSDGRVLGRHKGVGHYTIGQRRGLGIATGSPAYVTRIDARNNTVTLGDEAALLSRSLIADQVSFLVDARERRFRADTKIRYLHRASPATVEMLPDEASGTAGVALPLLSGDGETPNKRVRVTFDEPQRAVTPGQAVVFYDGDVVVGGGWISHVAPPQKGAQHEAYRHGRRCDGGVTRPRRRGPG